MCFGVRFSLYLASWLSDFDLFFSVCVVFGSLVCFPENGGGGQGTLAPPPGSAPDTLHQWSEIWHMALNTDKCFIMRVTLARYKYITILFNNSVQTGTLHQDCRRDAHVSSIHKKGSCECSGNHRPVSLTSQIVKLLLERVFQDHLLKNISLNKTISCHQHGFQIRCSSISQLIECLNDCQGSGHIA